MIYVNDIVELALQFVGETALFNKFAQWMDGEDVGAFCKTEGEKLDKLVQCFNLVNQEIAGEYLPFLTKETVETKDGIIPFSSLSKRVINIFEVKDRFGFNLQFKVMPTAVETKKSAKTVVYSFLPELCELESQIEEFCGLSERVYAYGVASKYLLLYGESGDAEVWEEKFRESLFILSRKHGEHRLPKRSWF